MKKINLMIYTGLVILIIIPACSQKIKESTKEEMKNTKKENVMEKQTLNQEMLITKVWESEIAETAHDVDVRKIYDQSTAQAIHIKLEAGESLKPHITPVDVFFYILEGVVDVMVGDEVKSVEADCLVESPKDIKHCLSNNTDKVARILVVKAPKQTTSSRIL